jgi:hypothetical protein
MSVKTIALVALTAFAATNAAAQSVGTQYWAPNLSGVYRCVHKCAGAGHAQIITRNGRQLDVTNEIGQPSSAWIDWPGHFWTDSWNQGAVYSADGRTIQFDSGSVWVLVVPTPIPGTF